MGSRRRKKRQNGVTPEPASRQRKSVPIWAIRVGHRTRGQHRAADAARRRAESCQARCSGVASRHDRFDIGGNALRSCFGRQRSGIFRTVQNRNDKSRPRRHRNSQSGFEALKGRWRRPDGGYVVDVKGVDENGKMDVSYANPKRINVSKAEASR